MHYFENFKNFVKAQIDLFQPLTILIGKNGAGKTNLIEGVEVLAHLAQGTPLYEFSDIGKGGRCEVRGGLASCIGFQEGNFGLRLADHRNSLLTKFREPDYSIKVRGQKHALVLTHEEFSVKEGNGVRKLFTVLPWGGGENMRVQYDNFARGGNNPTTDVSSLRSVLPRYEEIARIGEKSSERKKDAAATVSALRGHLQSCYIFDPDPKSMRGYRHIDARAKLSRNGSNLSVVLHAMRKKGENDKLERITKIIRNLPEEPFGEIDFVTTELGDVMLVFFASGNGDEKYRIDARLLSHGTLRMLAVLTALETVPEQSRIVMEEFDNGLHPSRINSLVSHVVETAERRKLNILITTHNPAFMNALDDEQMKSVVLCHRDSQSGHSNLTRLMEVPDADIMMLGGSLGDLVTREVVEKYLASDAVEKRRESIRRWQERART